jgi:hypothetical protein
MGDVSPSNSAEDEIVKFTVIRTSDAARKEVSSIDFHIEMNVCVHDFSACARVCMCCFIITLLFQLIYILKTQLFSRHTYIHTYIG